MTNKQLAKAIDNFLPFWEKEENCYEETLETLERNDTKELQEAYNYFVDMFGADKILAELKQRITENEFLEDFIKNAHSQHISHKGQQCYTQTSELNYYFLQCEKLGITPKIIKSGLYYTAKNKHFEIDWCEHDFILALK